MKLTPPLIFAFALNVATLFFAYTSSWAQDPRGLVLTVNSNADSADAAAGDRYCADSLGRCTLRAAIEESNAGTSRNAVIFDLTQPAVIDLTLGELYITQGLDIVGPGARRLTVRRGAGASNFRVFHLPQTQPVVNIRGITISNGSDLFGGGIFVENGGVLGLFDSAVTGNSGQIGGGIMSSGRITIIRCLINSNTSSVTGGAIANVGSTHEMTIANSTITGNTGASAGAIYNEGTLLLVNDTISANTGTQAVNGILSNGQGTVRVINTIIGRDTAPGNSLQGAFVSAGNNIVTNSNGSTGFTNGVNGDQVSANNIIDPMLGPLADNGGQTDTRALLTGSPAIDAGNDCVTTGQCTQLPGSVIFGSLDQRHRRRFVFIGHVDIGALEFGASATNSSGSFGVFTLPGRPAGRYLNTIVVLINPTTLEKRYSTMDMLGGYGFRDLPAAEAFVIEFRAKRSGLLTPFVLALEF